MYWNGFEQAVRAVQLFLASLTGRRRLARTRFAILPGGTENDLRKAGAGAALAGVLAERDLV
jgi:hypothetical protein